VRRGLKLLFGALVVVVVVVGAFGAWYVFGDRAPGKPKLTACVTSNAGPKTPDGAWHVVPSSKKYVGYRIMELFGHAVLKHEVVGRTDAVTGRMTIANGRVTTAVVSADLSQLASDRQARDAYIADNGLQSTKFPTARFTLTAPIAPPANVAKGQAVHAVASGTLLLHGVSRRITIALNSCWSGPTIDVVGTAPITLRDYGIQPPHTVIADVDAHGSMELDLEFATGSG
jgi:polyisoprenoid-binding protein YceI